MVEAEAVHLKVVPCPLTNRLISASCCFLCCPLCFVTDDFDDLRYDVLLVVRVCFLFML